MLDEHVFAGNPEDWDHLEEQLGSPEDPNAHARAGQLRTEGWELTGVMFHRGTWSFRRPVGWSPT